MDETLLHESLQLRDPVRLLQQVLRQWDRGDLWVFGYGSLIWRPEFEAEEQRPAQVHGYHRALRMRSRVNRGTPERPGLVYALLPGGCCRGVVYRLAQERVEEELPRLWVREMPTGVYDPRWLRCRTPGGPVRALAFTLSRRSPSYTGHLSEDELLEVLRHARGRYGSTLEYLLHTATALRCHGMPDRESEKLLALARRHRLLDER
ncbi:gamma-glutamylcyclotransferase [Azohydromonas caseinilytica]|uniref:glutathione-specific gamma-glutamylcyclotransferase n=1 Tax=Azohydromonas caseinilytica TaxID=2728836 RepID=A0A848F7P0_9BURK|nr:gamma-glutamylcyclotransferase [Azohydromonas caseinilytica]NML14363.1 gamma-glutamylcyclotransferase [Azohydromonas caseinilytica]